jgi:ankyrin repeat protein
MQSDKWEFQIGAPAKARTALHRAAECGDTATCGALLQAADKDAFKLCAAYTEQGETPLHLAAARGHHLVCSTLKEFGGPDLNLLRDAQKRTALHIAARHGHAEACRVLLEGSRQESADVLDAVGRTALHLAAEKGHAAACTAILDAPGFTKVNVRSNAGATAFEMAAARGHAEVCMAIHGREDFDAAGGRIVGASSMTAYAVGSMPRVGQVPRSQWPPSSVAPRKLRCPEAGVALRLT